MSVPPPYEVPWDIEILCAGIPLPVDDNGSFQAEKAASAGSRFEVIVPRGWIPDPAKRELRPSEASGEVPIPVSLHRAEPIPFTLQATDAATGEPIPLIELRVRVKYQEVECLRGLTQADGTLEANGGLPPGSYVVDVQEPGEDWWFEEIDLEHGFESPLHPVEVPVGPTYTLDWELPPFTEIDDFRAILTPSTDLDMACNGLGWSAGIRSGPRPWVRLRYDEDIEADIPMTRCWTLTVAHGEGGWLASGSTLEARGIVRDAIELHNETTGSFVGRMLDPEGRPIARARGGFVELTAKGRNWHYRSIQDGGFEFPNIRGGEWKLTLSAHGFADLEETIRIEPHHRVQRDFTLEAIPMGPPLRGRCVSETGTWRGSVSIWASHLGHSSTVVVEEEDWFQEDGRWVADFELEDVALETPRVRAHVRDERFTCAPVAPLGEGGPLVIRVLDDHPSFELHLEIRDGTTGESLSPRDLHGLPLPADLEEFRTELGDFRIPGVLCKDLDFRVFVPGYLPSEPIRRARPGRHGVERIQVTMHPGWGARVSLFEQAPDESWRDLAGIDVTLDGAVVGTTDDGGEVWISSDRPPRSLGVSASGWTIVPGWDVDPDGGAYQVAPWGNINIELSRD